MEEIIYGSYNNNFNPPSDQYKTLLYNSLHIIEPRINPLNILEFFDSINF